MERLVIKVSGQVVGVGFRYYIWQKVQSYNLEHKVADHPDVVGIVRNVGKDVEIVAEGEREDLLAILALAQEGPLLSEVRNVQSHFEKAMGNWSEFQIYRDKNIEQ